MVHLHKYSVLKLLSFVLVHTRMIIVKISELLLTGCITVLPSPCQNIYKVFFFVYNVLKGCSLYSVIKNLNLQKFYLPVCGRPG
jgi:hypothetical protein